MNLLHDALSRIAQLRAAEDHERAHDEALRLATAVPGEVRAQLAAAYTADRLGREDVAARHYSLAYELGVPAEERCQFLLCFGSALRNLGRTDEAIGRLTEAARDYPERPEVKAFLALAYHSAGMYANALAEMLEAALQAQQPPGFGKYSRALKEYKQELMDPQAESDRKEN